MLRWKLVREGVQLRTDSDYAGRVLDEIPRLGLRTHVFRNLEIGVAKVRIERYRINFESNERHSANTESNQGYGRQLGFRRNRQGFGELNGRRWVD